MLKLKLQYFGHLIWTANSLEETLRVGKIEGRRRRWWQRRWLDGIIDSVEFEQTLGDREGQGKDRGAWWAAIYGVAQSWTRLKQLSRSSSRPGWALKNWCFWTVMLEKTLESPLDCKEIQPVHPKGDQSWVFIGQTDAEAEMPPDVKNWFIWKDPDARKNWRWEEKEMTEDEMVGSHHWLNRHEFE